MIPNGKQAIVLREQLGNCGGIAAAALSRPDHVRSSARAEAVNELIFSASAGITGL
jgi:hypothetical protein